jgi:hypothetical protein
MVCDVPRKRMIDPSIWTDDGMANLTPRQQLLFIGLFSNADDAGRLKGSPAAIRLLLPTVYAAVKPDRITADLAAVAAHLRHVRLYEVDGRQYIALDNYRSWQRIDRPSDSQIPAPPAPPEADSEVDSSNGRRTVVEPSTSPRLEIRRREEKRSEVKEGEEGSVRGERALTAAVAAPSGGRAKRAPRPPPEAITDAFQDELVTEFAAQLGGAERVRASIAKALNHTASKKWLDHRRGLHDWLQRDAAEYARGETGRSAAAIVGAPGRATGAVDTGGWGVDAFRAFEPGM